ncbi:MAG: ABC transporter permease [Pseudomonadota bacterium]
MFQTQTTMGPVGSAGRLLWLIYHNTVRSVRKTHGNALMALVVNIFQTILMVGIFYAMFELLGMRGMAIRGDFLLYIMSGIFLYMTHIKALSAVVGSEGPASPMMNHLPMTTTVAIASAALGALYIQVLSMVVVLYAYHVFWTPIEIHDPVGSFGMVLMAWFSGVGVGMMFLAAKPWLPGLTQMVTQIWQRANMFASGKMFVANMLPAYMIALFDWNPLFHCVDQARGFMFINYNPHFSSVSYPFYVSLACLMVGMMGEFYTRRRVSASWNAKR